MFNISMMVFYFSIVVLMLQHFYEMSFRIRINNLKTVSHLKINRVLTEAELDSKTTRTRHTRDLSGIFSYLLNSFRDGISKSFNAVNSLNSLTDEALDSILGSYHDRQYANHHHKINESSTESTSQNTSKSLLSSASSPASTSHVSTSTLPTTHTPPEPTSSAAVSPETTSSPQNTSLSETEATTSLRTTPTFEHSTVLIERNISTTSAANSNNSSIFPSATSNGTLAAFGNDSNTLITAERSGGISSVACTGLLCTPGIAALPVATALLGSAICFFLLYKYTPVGSWLGRNNSEKKGKKRIHEEDVENILNDSEYSDETGESIAKKSKFDRFLRPYGRRLKYPYIDEDVTEAQNMSEEAQNISEKAIEDVTIL